jgi:hypothetical protein
MAKRNFLKRKKKIEIEMFGISEGSKNIGMGKKG